MPNTVSPANPTQPIGPTRLGTVLATMLLFSVVLDIVVLGLALLESNDVTDAFSVVRRTLGWVAIAVAAGVFCGLAVWTFKALRNGRRIAPEAKLMAPLAGALGVVVPLAQLVAIPRMAKQLSAATNTCHRLTVWIGYSVYAMVLAFLAMFATQVLAFTLRLPIGIALGLSYFTLACLVGAKSSLYVCLAMLLQRLGRTDAAPKPLGPASETSQDSKLQRVASTIGLGLLILVMLCLAVAAKVNMMRNNPGLSQSRELRELEERQRASLRRSLENIDKVLQDNGSPSLGTRAVPDLTATPPAVANMNARDEVVGCAQAFVSALTSGNVSEMSRLTFVSDISHYSTRPAFLGAIAGLQELDRKLVARFRISSHTDAKVTSGWKLDLLPRASVIGDNATLKVTSTGQLAYFRRNNGVWQIDLSKDLDNPMDAGVLHYAHIEKCTRTVIRKLEAGSYSSPAEALEDLHRLVQ